MTPYNKMINIQHISFLGFKINSKQLKPLFKI